MIISSSLIVFLIAVITINFILGLIVLFSDKGWKKSINRRFFYFTISSALWQFVNLEMLISRDLTNAIFWTRLTFIIAAIMIYFVFLFILIFPHVFFKSDRTNTIVSLLSSLPVAAIVILGFTHHLVESVFFENNILLANYGQLFYVFFLFVLIYLLAIFLIGFINYRRSEEDQKIKIMLILLGFAIGAGFMVFTDLISPSLLKKDFLSNFGAFGTIFLSGFMSYAIVKHRLFGIRVILTETAVSIVVLAVFLQTLFSKTINQAILNGAVLIFVAYGGYLIIKSVLIEIKQREQLQKVTKQLEQANLHLQELDKLKTEFVSIASHELLTPISAIMGYLSMILDEKLVPVEEKTRGYLEKVYNSSKRLAKLVEDLLNVSRIEQGRLVIDRQPMQIEDSIQTTVDELAIKAKEQNLELIYHKPEISLSKVYADPDKVKEVLVNLIGNSLKYTDKGRVEVSVEAKDSPFPKNHDVVVPEIGEASSREQGKRDKYIWVHIKDTGIGIPKEAQDEIFEKFHRVGQWATRETQGTGLGLYISKSIVEVLGGRIWLYSEGEGKGSEFSFSLPVATSEDKREISGDVAGLGSEDQKKLVDESKTSDRGVVIKEAPQSTAVFEDVAKDNRLMNKKQNAKIKNQNDK